RAYVATHDDADLRESLGPGPNPIAEIVPDLTARLADLEPTLPSADPPQARFRLFEAITTFWRRAAEKRPILLILDNVHWADAPSVRLLEFLAAEIADSRLLLLGTYRDIDLSRQHPLSDTLGNLNRHPWFQRVRLSGLSLPETGRFISAATGQVLSDKLIST